MHRLSAPVLLAVAGFMAAATVIVVSRNYGKFADLPLLVPITLVILAGLNAALARWVAKRIADHKVGQDRTQLHPVTAARCVALAQASAWTGAIFGGFYLGFSVYVVPRAGDLAAASSDAPRAIAATIAAILLVIAGIALERSCQVPPPGSENSASLEVQ